MRKSREGECRREGDREGRGGRKRERERGDREGEG